MHVYCSTLNLVTLLRLCSMPVFKIGLWEGQSKNDDMCAADRYTMNSSWFYSLQEYFFFLLWVLANISVFFLTLFTFWNVFLKSGDDETVLFNSRQILRYRKTFVEWAIKSSCVTLPHAKQNGGFSFPKLFAVPHQSTVQVIFHRYSELIGRQYQLLLLDSFSEWIIQMQTLQEM